MSELDQSTGPIRPWELDPTNRNGFKDPDDITARLKRQGEYLAQLAICQQCPFRGTGADLCADEVVWPSWPARLLLTSTCHDTLRAGGRKPGHGARQ